MKLHLSIVLKNFHKGCDRAFGMCSIHGYISSVAPAALDCDDILRSALVLAVSSFDLYLHDAFRTEVVHRLTSRKDVPLLNIPFNAAFLDGADQISLVDEYIRKLNSFKSFVAPDKLSECLRYLFENPWEKIALKLQLDKSFCKSKLRRVIDLRNRIAHEADVNPNYGGIELWPIYKQDAEEAITFLKRLGVVISELIDDT